MTGLDVVFLVASAVAVGSAAIVVTRRNPIYSALFMMVSLFALATIFLVLHSTFLAVIQVLLYAGAIMVLFVFVIMLLNPGPEEMRLPRAPVWQRALAVVFSAGLLFGLVVATAASDVRHAPSFSAPEIAPVAAPGTAASEAGTTERFASAIYVDFLLAFEAISLVILAAIAGAIVLGKRRLEPAAAAALAGEPVAGGGGATPPGHAAQQAAGTASLSDSAGSISSGSISSMGAETPPPPTLGTREIHARSGGH